jgi:hypothetical protein
MHNPLVAYLIGSCILSVGLVILLSAKEIARGLAHFLARWLGDDSGKSRGKRVSAAADSAEPDSYRVRLALWRVIGVFIVIDGFIWLARATAEVFRALPHGKP